MHLEKLRSLFAHWPALHPIRAENAPFIVHFLHQQFRASQRLAIRHDTLCADFVAYQDFLKEDAPCPYCSKKTRPNPAPLRSSATSRSPRTTATSSSRNPSPRSSWEIAD